MDDKQVKYMKRCCELAVSAGKKGYDYKKVFSLGARIIEPPAKKPWDAMNMSFDGPDHNIVYLRSFPKNAEEF